jgi:integrase
VADRFDIDFVTKSFGPTKLGHDLGLIRKASTSELRQFRRAVLGHRDVNTTMIYTHVLNRGPGGVRSLLNGL